MTVSNSKVQALETLLKKATDRLEVRLRTEQEPLPMEQYRLGLLMMRQSWWFRDLHSAAMHETALRIKDKGVREEIFKIIEKELSPYIHEGTIQTAEYGSINRNISHPGFPLENILFNLVDNSLVHGSNLAAQMFYRLLVEEGISCQHITIVSGLLLEEGIEVPLTDKIRLISLSGKKMEIPVYLPLSETRTQSDAARYYSGRCAILEDVYIRPRFVSPDVTLANRLPMFLRNGISWTRCDMGHNELCEALSLVANCVVVPVRWGSYIDETEIFKARTRPVRSAWSSVQNRNPGPVVSARELNTVNSILEGRRRLSEADQGRIQVAISWWRKSKSAKNLVDAFRNLGVTIENLYLSDGSRDRLRFRTARNAAWHLGRCEAEKNRLSARMKKVYDLRSTAVHTGQLTDPHADELRDVGQDICRKSLIRILEEGAFPDWQNIMADGD